MSLTEWAKNEVAIAINSISEDKEEIEYGAGCYNSALKAFLGLMSDGHSGMSMGITKHILTSLMDGRPLTPINDTPDIWRETTFQPKQEYKTYQCIRMFSLFKEVYDNGDIRYSDNNQSHCIDIDTRDSYYSPLVAKIISDMFPIKFPYMPPTSPIKVYCTDFLVDEENGDYDTVGIFYGESTNVGAFDINRYFKEVDGVWTEIEEGEYHQRLSIRRDI